MSKYGVFTNPNTGIFGPEKPQYLDTFQAVYTKYLQEMEKWFLGNVKTLIREIAIQMTPNGQFPPVKLPPRKIPTQDSSHPENSHLE